jgi:mRNA interferase HigB
MTILNAAAITKFARKHRDAARALDNWLGVAAGATWRSIAEVRRTFPSADGVPLARSGVAVVATVFNIRGGHYRLITVIDFGRGVISIADVLTHGEYDKDKWKDRL